MDVGEDWVWTAMAWLLIALCILIPLLVACFVMWAALALWEARRTPHCRCGLRRLPLGHPATLYGVHHSEVRCQPVREMIR